MTQGESAHMSTPAFSTPAAKTANCSDASILVINVHVQIYAHSYRLKMTTVEKTITVGEYDYGRE